MKTWVLLTIIGVSAVAVGASGGVIYKRCIAEPTIEVDGFSAEYCKVDGDALIKKVSGYGTPENAVKSMKPYEIVNFACESFKRAENCYSFGVGRALASVVDQKIHNLQIKNGSTYFEESVASSSMVGVAARFFQEKGKDKVEKYKIKAQGDEVLFDGPSKYLTNPETYTIKEFSNWYGRDLIGMFNHIIHELTVTKESIKNIDGGYQVELELDPNTAAYSYKNQVMNISGNDVPMLKAPPTFKSIHLTFMLDKNLMLKENLVDEVYYSVANAFPMPIETHNTIKYVFHYNEYYKIPSLEEYFEFPPFEEA